MLLEILQFDSSKTLEWGKQCKKRRSLYFSSSKALLRSRMTRARKDLSRTGQSSDGGLRRAIENCFNEIRLPKIAIIS